MKVYDQLIQFKPVNDQEKNDQKIMLDWLNQYGKQVLTRENEVAHFTSSAIILNPTFDKICMIHHNIYKTWTWVGGHNDGSEDFIETALKEANEETGLSDFEVLSNQILSVEILPVFDHYKRGKYVSAHLHMNASVVLIADENQPLMIKEDENSGVKWVAIEEIGNYSNEPELIAVYMKLINKAKALKEVL